jgi:aminopeptidase N
MAHELSHHWWGDLATCRTEPEMWLNEGWASYSEYIFTEWYYGRAAYDADVLANHDDMVHFVHHRENGFQVLNGVPHQYTYGDHVYLKGADIAHCLRGYMGDSLFFAGLHYHLQQSQYTDVNSADFRDNLIAATGLTYLNDFFNDWVFNPGWPQFEIDSAVSVPNGPNYDVTVYVQQKLFGAPQFYTNVPLEFSFYDAAHNETSSKHLISGQYDNFTVTLQYDPALTSLDVHNLISDAETDEARTITATGTINLNLAKCTLTVNTLPDTAYIRVIHNYVKPDPIISNPNNYHISQQRYWKVEGILPAGFYATARFYYDGRISGTSGSGYWLDNDLTVPNGDSIMLLYRRDASDEWHEWPYYTKFVIGASVNSKFGYMTVDSVALGEYTFANGVSTVLGVAEQLPEAEPEIIAYPNPAYRDLTVEWPGVSGEVLVEIYDMNGALIHSENVQEERLHVKIENWSGGNYLVNVSQQGKNIGRKQVVIIH